MNKKFRFYEPTETTFVIPITCEYMSKEYNDRNEWLRDKTTKFDFLYFVDLFENNSNYVMYGSDAEEIALLFRLKFQ